LLPLQGKTTVMFGVPDCGKVCTQTHLPGYVKQLDALRKLGVGQVVCVAVGDAAAAAEWGAKAGAGGGVAVAADTNGALTRFLGMEQGAPDAAGARSLRYAAVVEDGVLLKLRVEKALGETKESSAEAMIKLLKTMQA
jgi:peroxiredoxin